MASCEPILRVQDLSVSFSSRGGAVQALRGISFDLMRGETVALVGESGAGKSVCARAIMGLLAENASISGGFITYAGQDLTKAPEEDMRKIRGGKIGLVPQDPLSALNPLIKVGSQITEALRLGRKMPREDARLRAVELMEAVGIPDAARRFNQRPFQLSGGMRQRMVIAIALARDPEILICDEPTTALDVTVQARILELIGVIKKQRGLSVVYITHDLGVAAGLADRIAVMYAGKIVEIGTAEEIFLHPAHPYTWALLSSLPGTDAGQRLTPIPGAPPDMTCPPPGDAFAPRNPRAMKIDYLQHPPFFRLSDTHFAATWLLHKDAPPVEMPTALNARIQRMKAQAVAPGLENNNEASL